MYVEIMELGFLTSYVCNPISQFLRFPVQFSFVN